MPRLNRLFCGGRLQLLGFCLVVLLLGGAAFAQQGIIEDIRIHGNRRIPADYHPLADVYPSGRCL